MKRKKFETHSDHVNINHKKIGDLCGYISSIIVDDCSFDKIVEILLIMNKKSEKERGVGLFELRETHKILRDEFYFWGALCRDDIEQAKKIVNIRNQASRD